MNYPEGKSSYQIEEEISSKNDTKIFKAICLANNSHVAMKVINLTTAMDQIPPSITDPKLLQQYTKFAVNEQGALSSYVIMPFMTQGSVAGVLTSINGGLDETLVGLILKEVTEAIETLHAQGYYHGGIKPGNIFVDGDSNPPSVKLCSSFCKRTASVSKTQSNSKYWLPPESFDTSAVADQKQDIWMLGITALEMIYGYPPVVDCKTPSFERVGDPELFCYYLQQKHMFSAKFKNFVIRCLNPDQASRPTAAELLQDPFLQFENENSINFLDDTIYNMKLYCQLDNEIIQQWSLSKKFFKLKPKAASAEEGHNGNENEPTNFMVPVRHIQQSVQLVQNGIKLIKGNTTYISVRNHLKNIEKAVSTIEDSAIQLQTLLEG